MDGSPIEPGAGRRPDCLRIRTALALAIVFGPSVWDFYAVSLAQVAFRRRGVFGAAATA